MQVTLQLSYQLFNTGCVVLIRLRLILLLLLNVHTSGKAALRRGVAILPNLSLVPSSSGELRKPVLPSLAADSSACKLQWVFFPWHKLEGKLNFSLSNNV